MTGEANVVLNQRQNQFLDNGIELDKITREDKVGQVALSCTNIYKETDILKILFS